MRFSLWAAGLAVAAAVAAPASAAVFTATYTGTVRAGTISTSNGTLTSGIDTRGLFGAVGGNLVGMTYTAVYTVDDQAPGATNTENPGVWSQTAGASVAGPHPQGPVTLAFTLNGVTLNIGNNGGQAFQSFLPTNGYNQVSHSAEDLTFEPGGSSYLQTTINNSIGDSFNSITTSYRYDTPLSYTALPNDDAFGNLIVTRTAAGDTAWQSYFSLKPTSVEIALKTDPQAVPEPSQWLLMIAGFGLMGGALRRRRFAHG